MKVEFTTCFHMNMVYIMVIQGACPFPTSMIGSGSVLVGSFCSQREHAEKPSRRVCLLCASTFVPRVFL